LPLEHYHELPESVRPLLVRAFSYAMLTRGQGADARGGAPRPSAQPAAKDPSSWGKVGRNDPCPCGSGKKHKQCHGRLS
jgi:uncharacterized protein YecA (UPF0149 family)